jgi:N-acetylglucosamine transport system permease protein
VTATQLVEPRVPAPSPTPGERKSQVPVQEKVFAGVSHAVLVLWSLVVVLPLLWTLMTSFKTTSQIFSSPFTLPTSLNFANYVNAWTTAGIGSAFLNTVIVVGSALALVMILGAMCSYVLARFSFPGNRLI